MYYHGSKAKDFKIEAHVSSRYGFSALFLTTEMDLARMYAGPSGSVTAFEVYFPDKTIDYRHKFSYSGEFRNLVIDCFRKGYKSVLIRNVMDCPAVGEFPPIPGDIMIVYDFKQLVQSV